MDKSISLHSKAIHRKSQLKFHKHKRGSGIDELKCSICHAVFEREDKFKEHKESHLICPLCNKSFKSAKLLRIHSRTFHGISKDNSDQRYVPSSSEEDEQNICEDLSMHKVKEEPIELVSEPEIENLLNHDPNQIPSNEVSPRNNVYYPESKTLGGIWRNFTETPTPSPFLNAFEHSSVPIKLEPVEHNAESDQFDFIINEILRKPSQAGNPGTSKLSLVAEEVPLQQNFWTQSESNLQTPETFICDICDKQFSTKQILQRHRVSLHEKEKDFKCDQCDAWFSSSNNHELIMHVNSVHNGFKKFICQWCNKEFSRKDALKRHEVTHNSKNNIPLPAQQHRCFDCGASFKYQTSLLLHLKNHQV